MFLNFVRIQDQFPGNICTGVVHTYICLTINNCTYDLPYNVFTLKQLYFEEHHFYENITCRNTTSATTKIIVCVRIQK